MFPSVGAGIRAVGRDTAKADLRLGSHLGSQSLRTVDVHGRPKQVGDLLKGTRRTGLNCRSQISKAREGSRPPWVQIPPLPPYTWINGGSSTKKRSVFCCQGLSCRRGNLDACLADVLIHRQGAAQQAVPIITGPAPAARRATR